MNVDLYATSHEPVWYEGSIVSAENKVLTGKISINVQYNLVLYHTSEGLKVIPAHKVRSVSYYDVGSNINRRFVSYRHVDKGYPLYKIYEVVVQGEVTVLRRGIFFNGDEAVDFSYYLVHDNHVMPLKKFRTKIFPLMKRNAAVARHMKTEHLNPNFSKDAILLIKFYNTLSYTENAVAMRY